MMFAEPDSPVYVLPARDIVAVMFENSHSSATRSERRAGP
jgi:hypothetical protein